MKKIVSLLLIGVLLCALLFSFASCGKKVPEATYESAIGWWHSYTFDGKKVTVKDGDVSFEGTYEIKKNGVGQAIIAFRFEGEGAEEYSEEKYYEKGEDETGSYIRLDGVKFYEKKNK